VQTPQSTTIVHARVVIAHPTDDDAERVAYNRRHGVLPPQRPTGGNAENDQLLPGRLNYKEFFSKVMKTIELPTWDHFATTIAEIRAQYGSRVVEDGNGNSMPLENDIVFRGHADARWRLETTLERTTRERYSVQQYLERADSVVNEIESITGTDCKMPDFPAIREEIQNCSDSMRAHVPCYEYLVYLRHHGFPSPLLDWTRSPYIAAFFALEQQCDVETAAVIAFIETPDGGKMHSGGDPMIRSLGSYVTTHSRHFAQKGSYSIATVWDPESKKHYFCPHEDFHVPLVGTQDVLIKISFPRSDRIRALKQLNDYNINHFTLFQTDDALIRSLGQRAFELE